MSEVSQLLQAAAAAGQQQLLLMGLRAQCAMQIYALHVSRYYKDEDNNATMSNASARALAVLAIRDADALIDELRRPPRPMGADHKR
jgi:hypothetical protein